MADLIEIRVTHVEVDYIGWTRRRQFIPADIRIMALPLSGIRPR